MVDGVRLGAHGVGGLWAIGLSVFAIRTRMLPVVIGWLGIAVGAMRGANLFVPALANVRFPPCRPGGSSWARRWPVPGDASTGTAAPCRGGLTRW